MKNRRLISFLCAIAMSLTLVLPVSAANINNQETIEPMAQERGPQYVYKTEYLPVQRTTVGDYAANQLPEGVYLSNPGDSINYTLNGGTQVTGGVSISLPPPYNFVSFGASIGRITANSVGDYSKTLGNLPAGYYRLYIEKTYEISPYVTYVKHAGAQYTEWEIERVGCLSEYMSAKATLVRVGA